MVDGVSYATIAQFQARYDARLVAQWSNDTNGTTQTSANVQAALDDASAAILTACLQGSIYSASDLTTLVSGGDTALVRLCCDIAIGYMAERRGQGLPGQLQRQADEAGRMLDALRRGQRVLNVSANRAADVPATVTLTADERSNLGSLTASDFFGDVSGTATTSGST